MRSLQDETNRSLAARVPVERTLRVHWGMRAGWGGCLLVLTTSCAGGRVGLTRPVPIVVPRDEVEPEEYLVYEVVLAQRFAPHCSEMVVSGMSFGMRNQAGAMCPRPGRPLFLHPVAVVRVPAPRRTIALDGTVFGTPMDTVAGMGLAGLRQDTLDNYRRRPPAAVAARFRTPVELPIARSDREYPRFFFTRVGFSDDGAQALMYEAFEEPARYDQGCSDGVYYLLSKRDGSWVIDQARRVDGGCS